ncbi:MAG TPA: hypothetical protein VJ929_00810 [Roseovarius sp.]|nr:hypothetical protein [Roseovarius sp.]
MKELKRSFMVYAFPSGPWSCRSIWDVSAIFQRNPTEAKIEGVSKRFQHVASNHVQKPLTSGLGQGLSKALASPSTTNAPDWGRIAKGHEVTAVFDSLKPSRPHRRHKGRATDQPFHIANLPFDHPRGAPLAKKKVGPTKFPVSDVQAIHSCVEHEPRMVNSALTRTGFRRLDKGAHQRAILDARRAFDT